jgi:transcriptional regulator with XRE-family HTH domain
MKRTRDSKKFLRTVGRRFHALRKKEESEVESVAKAVGISGRLLLRIEEGDYDMYIDLLFELCDYYKITPHDFLRDVDKLNAKD